MSAFDQLDPMVQHHIVNTLGWRSLRPLQEESIPPILAGEHCLLLAPTAGGKTEAAFFPLLSRLCSSDWTGPSILYICPLRALLNNLFPRLQEYCAMVGRTCALWHGDVSASARNRIRREPPDILLTTPESLEVLLISARSEGRDLLRQARVAVIDEIHAFAGDDRGWHLLSVLERIGRLAGREIQRIGLSATVGNPGDLLEWMAGHCTGARRVVNPPARAIAGGTEVLVDFVGSLENAALVISRLYPGEKRLVFCDSRAKVEQLGLALRQLGVTTWLSHSSLSAEERREAEAAFAQARDCVIVATSTLELGIDIGDLDRVVQIDAPRSVASFLQRIGRTGRRAGSTRNCLFLATSEDALLRAAAVVALWEKGYVEPVRPPCRPLHVFAQQIMALALQEKGIGLRDWPGWIARIPPFAGARTEEQAEILAHLGERGILVPDADRLWFGDNGEALYGRRHFLELVSVFTSPPVFLVLHGRKEIGTVDQISLLQHRPGKPALLGLAGRSWWVETVDWPNRIAQVVPSEDDGKSRWLGARMGVPWSIARVIRQLLLSREMPRCWSGRARLQMAGLREAHAFLEGEDHFLVVDPKENELRWHTFAGGPLNSALTDGLRTSGYPEARADDYSITLTGTTDAISFAKVIASFTPAGLLGALKIPDAYLEQMKFNECLPQGLAAEMIKDRWPDLEKFDELLSFRTRILNAP